MPPTGPDRMTAARALDALVSRVAPAGAFRDIEEQRTARMVVLSAMVLVTQVPVFAVFYAVIGRTGLAAELVGAGVSLVAIPSELRRSVPLARRHVLTVLAVTLGLITVTTGGLEAPALSWLAIVPILALWAGGRRSALGWLGAVVGFVLGLGAWSAVHGELPVDLPVPVRLVLEALGVLGLVAVLYGVAASFESTRTSALQAVADANRSMREVFDNVAQGFVTVEPNGHMLGQRSAIIERWLGRPVPGDTFFSWVGRTDPSLGAWLEVAWMAIPDGILPVEVVLDQLPRRLMAGGRTIGLSYRALAGADGVVERIIVIGADVTAQLAAERSESQQRDAAALLFRMMEDESGTLRFIDETSAALEAVHARPPGVLRVLHTLKGTAAVIGLSRLATACHAAESAVADGVGAEEAVAALDEEWRELLLRLGPAVRTRRGILAVPAVELKELLVAIDLGLSVEEVRDVVATWNEEPVRVHLQRLGRGAEGVARRVEKPPPRVTVVGGEFRLDGTRFASLWSALVHVVRNAVDHGLEAPAVRIAAGKPAAGELRLGAWREGDRVRVLVADDGGGVDWARVAERARALGFDPEDGLVDALFAEGLSTRSELTEVSGRGVGLAAVRAVCRQLGGDAEVESTPGEGTTFQFVVPVSAATGEAGGANGAFGEARAVG